MTKVSKVYFGFSRTSASRRGRYGSAPFAPLPVHPVIVRVRGGHRAVSARSRASRPAAGGGRPGWVGLRLGRGRVRQGAVVGLQGVVDQHRQVHVAAEELGQGALDVGAEADLELVAGEDVGHRDHHQVGVQGHRLTGVQPTAQLRRRGRPKMFPGPERGFGRALWRLAHSFSMQSGAGGPLSGASQARLRPTPAVGCRASVWRPAGSSSTSLSTVVHKCAADRRAPGAIGDHGSAWRSGQARNDPAMWKVKAKRDASNAGTFVQPNREKSLVVRRVGWTERRPDRDNLPPSRAV